MCCGPSRTSKSTPSVPSDDSDHLALEAELRVLRVLRVLPVVTWRRDALTGLRGDRVDPRTGPPAHRGRPGLPVLTSSGGTHCR